MRKHLWAAPITVLLSAILLTPARAVSAPDATVQAGIRTVLDQQVAAWNRGDISSFMQGYKNDDDTTFIGKTVEHGYARILARYQRKYASRQQMGTLTFSDLNVRPLDAHYAIVTGHFHLDRTSAAGGKADGIFSLVFEKTTAGWKIILDHTA